jgi:hypothetical protein
MRSQMVTFVKSYPILEFSGAAFDSPLPSFVSLLDKTRSHHDQPS